MTTTVSAKIPEDLKQELDRANVNISETVRKALEAEVRRRRRDEIRQRAAAVRESSSGAVEADEIAALVRDQRDDR